MFGDPFAVMNTVGVVAFALVGSTKAIREGFDLFGVVIVGLVVAFAGGATRDLLVTRVPLVLQSPVEICLGLLGVGLAVVLSAGWSSPDTHPVVLVADAIGLAAFTTTGAIVAIEANVSAFGLVTIAVINAVGGGAVADILLDRSPFILFDDFYASCAVLGGVSYVLTLPSGAGTTAVVCVVSTLFARVTAISYEWTVPTVQELGLVRE